jgi:protein-tyrosine phosphatase
MRPALAQRRSGSIIALLVDNRYLVISRILVVCTGNICRSPIGEGLLRARAPKAIVASAGVGAMVGWPADPLSIEVMQEKGHDIGAHRAQQITRALLAENDLILTLDRHHSEWINNRYPEFRGKVHKILRWQDNADVPDPYRMPKAAFEQSYQLIDSGVGDWLKRL